MESMSARRNKATNTQRNIQYTCVEVKDILDFSQDDDIFFTTSHIFCVIVMFDFIKRKRFLRMTQSC